MNKFIELNYKKWLKLAIIITLNKNASDLLHDLIIKIISKNIPLIKLTDNYIFISLRNLHITTLTKNKIDYNVSVDLIQKDVLNETDLISIYIEDINKQEKLDIIVSTLDTMNHFERKLYTLHFIYGLSQRKIAREINVSHLTINQRINKIKNKIKQNYETK